MEWMDKLIEQAPWAAALTVVVVVFVRYLKIETQARTKKDELYDKRLGKMIELFTDTAKEGHDVAMDLGKALTELRVQIAGANKSGK